MKFIIEGGRPLKGVMEVSGAKNAALKMITASILSDKPSTLSNVPEISDIKTMIKIIEGLGGKVKKKDSRLTIDASSLNHAHPPDDLIGLIRASVVVVGPLLARFGKAQISQPGGCLIGARPITTHIDAFQKLGAKVTQRDGYIYFEANKLKGQTVVLDEMSVTATENILMAACLAQGETEIKMAAAEPEIEDLAHFLNKMGAKIQGAGTHVIKIKGVKKLKGASYKVIPDRIEAGTLAIAAAASKGEVEIKNVIPSHLDMFLDKLKQANVNLKVTANSLFVKPTTIFHPIFIDTRPYPGFPTDLQAPMAVLLTQANGTSKIFETLYEDRFNYVKELVKMGASATILDPHTLIIQGPRPLYGKKITTYDLRAGATLVIASLIATGKSEIENIELIDRGYEGLDKRLNKLGAKIQRVE